MNGKRHAWLIAAHKNQEQLEMLLNLMDAVENDLYLHIDIKTKDLDFDQLKTHVKKGRLYFTDRVDVGWGQFSIVESTYIMLRAAMKNGPYAYYHLISGQDMPLKPIEEINAFYDGGNPEINYIDIKSDEWCKTATYLRICYFSRFLGSKFLYSNQIIRKLSWPFRKIRWRILSIGTKYSAGSAWFDVNQDLAEKIIANDEWVRKHFRTFLFPDEAFLQSLVYKLGIREKCTSTGRFVDWEHSPDGRHPYTFRASDYDRLVAAAGEGFHFARKLDWETDKDIVVRLYERLLPGVSS